MSEPSLQITTITRLDEDAYKQLVKSIGVRLAPPETDLQAAYQLGVQAVLEKLRQGFVIGGY